MNTDMIMMEQIYNRTWLNILYTNINVVIQLDYDILIFVEIQNIRSR